MSNSILCSLCDLKWEFVLLYCTIIYISILLLSVCGTVLWIHCVSVQGVKLYDCVDEVFVVKSNFSSRLTDLSITGSMSFPLSEDTGAVKLHTDNCKTFGSDIISKTFSFHISYIYCFCQFLVIFLASDPLLSILFKPLSLLSIIPSLAPYPVFF